MKAAALSLAVASTMALAQGQTTKNPYLSLQIEIKEAIARGNAFLAKQQQEDGHWDNAELPAFSALALTAAVRDPAVEGKKELPAHIAKGFDWLLKQQKEDGGIYNKGLSVYNTATSVTALSAADRPEFVPAILKGRKHLVGEQWDTGEKGKTDGKYDGGIGYGSKNDRSDLSNTYLAIEAMALSNKFVEDGADAPDLDWNAAAKFLSRCQNLPGSNDQEWASDDAKNKGGFIYNPGETKAGEDKLPDGRTALRSYGSISYAGLLSLIYAKVGPDDPRVVAVKEWLGKNYTLEENPGMGAAGIYYYYQTMSKALSAAGVNKLKLADGKEVDWRTDLANALLKKQNADGSWANSDGRWMESNPNLVTAYSVMSLAQIYYSIPEQP
ncbi:prenyltransferase/squalene oxidase repeat-containing protein [Luteolibacter luteus]|uniref:Terpene cyclase/mutase family protein n=1 Tax=Luteolibacter luteus TaxID=2728835 RepID=A0A858RN87_9BACT|nr:prenyltransferase/squalene oxidase repeat-containing protein [Luteolibacter luteus]QJE98185.1 terpene cyclase/mutase family protein [Luteolibacter luteus]